MPHRVSRPTPLLDRGKRKLDAVRSVSGRLSRTLTCRGYTVFKVTHVCFCPPPQQRNTSLAQSGKASWLCSVVAPYCNHRETPVPNFSPVFSVAATLIFTPELSGELGCFFLLIAKFNCSSVSLQHRKQTQELNVTHFQWLFSRSILV